MRTSQTFLFLFCMLPFLTFAQITYTVNTTDDLNDGTCDATHCSLREAINASNADGGASNIHFNISGTAPFLISLNSPLPSITENSTSIDGCTQPGWESGNIIIDGTNTVNHSGIDLLSSFNQIYGLQIQNFYYSGIQAEGTHNIIGELNKGNILIDNNTGIYFLSDTSSLANYNLIGLDASNSDRSNNFGIVISNNSYKTLMRDNHICFNNEDGIRIGSADSIIIKHNYIGTDSLQLSDWGNTEYGVYAFVTGYKKNITIEDNFISFNKRAGLNITNTNQIVIKSNSIGSNGYRGVVLNYNLSDSLTTIIENNSIGTDHTGTRDMGHIYEGIFVNPVYLGSSGSSGSSKTIVLENQIAYNNGYGLTIQDSTLVSQNSIFCNSKGGIQILEDDTDANEKSPPIIIEISDMITGISEPSDTIELFLSNTKICSGSSCQGEIYIGNTVADINGNWNYSTPSFLAGGDVITATATSVDRVTSEFATCYIILPDICLFAEQLSVNVAPCSTVGTVLDLIQLTNLSTTTTTCYTPSDFGDAWYFTEISSTGNMLIRTNINNGVVPVIEAYTGDCDNLVLQQCEVLDSVPYAIIFENYTPNTPIYLRAWHQDGATITTPVPYLHLTAHELPLDKDEWEVCDYENNLINGNPTIISERDANSFILEHDSTATAADIAAAEAELIAEGANIVGECLCNATPLQLWEADTPIDLEEKRLSAKAKASVDTTNYNYIFETIEFQVNSYAIGQQYGTDVAMDEEGNFVMVWIDQQRRHNYGRVYKSSGNPITQEFQLGPSDRRQYITNIEIEDDGDFTAVWHEIDPTLVGATPAIYGRQYHADGLPKNVAFSVSAASAVSSPDPLIQQIAYAGENPEIGMNNTGEFAVVWNVGRRVFAQRFDNAANLLGNIIEVGISVSNNCLPQAAIDMNNSGAFVITWTGLDSDATGIYAQRYDASGSPIGSEILVNTTQTKAQSKSDIALLDNGNFIIVWESFEQEGAGFDYDVYGQRFDISGSPIGGEFHINTYSLDTQREPSISHFSDGSFAVAWSSRGQDGYEEGIYAKFFDASGNPIAPVFDDSSNGSLGEEFRMNTYEAPEQERPRTATNGNNILIGAWEDGANDGSFKGIFGQRYEVLPSGTSKIFYPIGTATPSTLLGDELPYSMGVYEATTDKRDVKVAIIDTGIDNNNPLFANALWTNPAANDLDNCVLGDSIGYDFVNNTGIPMDLEGHGTRVSGVVARDFDTGVQLELMNLKFHELNKGSVFNAICAIYYAVDNGAEILNLSWGFEASEFPSILNRALQYASDKGVLIITSAGNTSKDNDRLNKFPANLNIENMIVVTAYEYKQSSGQIRLANYASYGKTKVDIAARGFLECPTVGNTLDLSAGTSLAAPLVARTAAIIKGLYPNLTAGEIKDCILNSAAYEYNLRNFVASEGILDHDAALACAKTKAGPEVAIRVFLQGPLSGTNMTNALPPLGTFPMSEPYTALGGYGMLDNTGISTKQEILTDKSIVDWVVVELRDNTTNPISKRAALLGKDGYIIDPVSGECLFFPEATAGNNYYIVIRHRNHLGVMSATKIQLN